MVDTLISHFLFVFFSRTSDVLMWSMNLQGWCVREGMWNYIRVYMCTRVFVCVQIGQGVLNEGGFKVLSSCVLGLRRFLIFS